MTKESIQINVPKEAVKEGQVVINGELVVREGKANDIRQTKQFDFEGNISSPGEYLRVNEKNIDKHESYVVADKDGQTITLKANIHNEDPYKTVVGKVKTGRLLKRLPINTDQQWGAQDLGILLKKNKILFADEFEFNKIVGKLLRFQGKINTILEDSREQSGNMKFKIEKKVESEIPESVTLKAAIFEGEEKTEFKLEIYAQATSNSVQFSLESTDLIELREVILDQIFERETGKFKEFDCPIFYK